MPAAHLLEDLVTVEKYPVTSQQLGRYYQRAFPRDLTDESLAGTLAVLVRLTTRPVVEPGDKVSELTPEKQPQGHWQQVWEVIPLDADGLETMREQSKEQVRQIANQKAGVLTSKEGRTFAELDRVLVDPAPQGADYPLMVGIANGKGFNLPDTIAFVKSTADPWNARAGDVLATEHNILDRCDIATTAAQLQSLVAEMEAFV